MPQLYDLPDITSPEYQPIWKLALVRTGKRLQREPSTDELVEEYASLLEKFTEPDGTINLKKKVFTPMVLPYRYVDIPGLVIREMALADVDVIAPRMAYKTIEVSRSAIITRMNDPFTQCLAWEYKGRLVQTESLRLKPDGSVEIGTSVHCMPRTAAFWREIEKPVFKRLYKLGIKTISTLTLNTLLEYWKPIIQDFYKGTAGRVSPLTTQFTYPLDLTVFSGLPKRLTVANWEWIHEVAGVKMREMRENEFATIQQKLAESWGETHPRLRIVRNILEEQFVLDRSTVLVAYQGDNLVGVFSIRARKRPGEGHIASCTKESDPETSLLWRVIYKGACDWAYAAGYTTLTNMVPEEIWNHSTKRKILQHTRATVVGRRTAWLKSAEVVRDLVAIHNEPISAWEQWDPTRPAMPEFKDIS